MTLSYLRNILFLSHLFALSVRCQGLAFSGEAITTRFWDCCKPSCGWKQKAPFSRPVLSCGIDEKPLDIAAGTGCNGGNAYLCSDQQPWVVNETFSYGFAGIFLPGHNEDFWCCSCYQLDFTSDPLRGKSMIVQASNTAYDINTANRFSLAVPGGNTTSYDACAKQYGVDQTVFGENHRGVGSKEDCDGLPQQLQPGCRWRYDWFQDASYPSANFKRVVCPAELTDRTLCKRNDEKALAEGGSSSAAPTSSSPASFRAGALAVIIAALLSA
ncbi:endoglucanase 1 precursor [Massariosphaeria phaeospora]|uniref:cellulase n=1 Tax=Massariosphaeria phaeospora TaxID=100035 RepID=A0A7C8IA13_9PLEO|nr:endoglucanase 1 precursor [Massariosphaeria phaeospora]